VKRSVFYQPTKDRANVSHRSRGWLRVSGGAPAFDQAEPLLAVAAVATPRLNRSPTNSATQRRCLLRAAQLDLGSMFKGILNPHFDGAPPRSIQNAS
jgi:hypothetical protein